MSLTREKWISKKILDVQSNIHRQLRNEKEGNVETSPVFPVLKFTK